MIEVTIGEVVAWSIVMATAGALIVMIVDSVLGEIDDHRQARRRQQRVIDNSELPSVNGADAPPDDDGDGR